MAVDAPAPTSQSVPHAAPRDCPVCGGELAVTRLGCPGCGSELSGRFAACAYCALGAEDRQLLAVFLASRGNLKEVERHLQVSYPTARQRFDALLGRLGVEPGPPAPPAPAPAAQQAQAPRPEDVLAQLATGKLDVDTAERMLRGATT